MKNLLVVGSRKPIVYAVWSISGLLKWFPSDWTCIRMVIHLITLNIISLSLSLKGWDACNRNDASSTEEYREKHRLSSYSFLLSFEIRGALIVAGKAAAEWCHFPCYINIVVLCDGGSSFFFFYPPAAARLSFFFIGPYNKRLQRTPTPES